jgi:hypothetical protein
MEMTTMKLPAMREFIREMIWYLVNDGLTKCTDVEVEALILGTPGFSLQNQPSKKIFRDVILHVLSVRKELSMRQALYPIPKEEEEAAISHVIGYVMGRIERSENVVLADE